MMVSATSLANDSKAVIDRVIERRETADVVRHGKAVAQIRRKVGVSKTELREILSKVRFTKEEQAELTDAMNEASKVFGYAGSH